MEEFLYNFFNAKDIMPGFLVMIILSYLGFGIYNYKKYNDWHNKQCLMIMGSFFILLIIGIFLLFTLAQFAGMAFNFMKSLYLK